MYLQQNDQLWIAQGDTPVYLSPAMANRHGLITGATGTGKTISLKVLAESFSAAGVPVFMQDIKGDLSGICLPGTMAGPVQKRVEKLKLGNYPLTGFPTRFFDVMGRRGHCVRATISGMGPDLISRILELNDTQSGIISLIFKIADDRKLLLIDLKDLQELLLYVSQNIAEFKAQYGYIAPQSIGAIQRSLLRLSQVAGDAFFGEPELNIMDWLCADQYGRGFINVLDCVELFQSPMLYSTFMLWLLSELYETLPEVGDLPKPRLAFFFDEAHLLFDGANKQLLQKIEQVVRLIRSKGVGIYFVTQSPSDIPDDVLSQLGNKIQHALRAYTPSDQKALRAAARSFRPNPAFDCEDVIPQLATGEALISLLEQDGAPGIVTRAFMLPPQSRLSPIDDSIRAQVIAASSLRQKYDQPIDRYSAYEALQQIRIADEDQAQYEQRQYEQARTQSLVRPPRARQARTQESMLSRELERGLNSVVNTMGRELGRDIIRGLFGTRRR